MEFTLISDYETKLTPYGSRPVEYHSQAGYAAKRLPILCFTKHLKAQIDYLLAKFPSHEFSVFLGIQKINPFKPHFLASELYITKQEVTGGFAKTDGKDSGRLFKELSEQDYYKTYGLHRNLAHLHSHDSMPCFWSQTDLTCQYSSDELGGYDAYRLYIVVNTKGDIKFSLVTYDPLITSTDGNCFVYDDGTSGELTDEEKAELDALTEKNIVISTAAIEMPCEFPEKYQWEYPYQYQYEDRLPSWRSRYDHRWDDCTPIPGGCADNDNDNEDEDDDFDYEVECLSDTGFTPSKAGLNALLKFLAEHGEATAGSFSGTMETKKLKDAFLAELKRLCPGYCAADAKSIMETVLSTLPDGRCACLEDAMDNTESFAHVLVVTAYLCEHSQVLATVGIPDDFYSTVADAADTYVNQRIIDYAINGYLQAERPELASAIYRYAEKLGE